MGVDGIARSLGFDGHQLLYPVVAFCNLDNEVLEINFQALESLTLSLCYRSILVAVHSRLLADVDEVKVNRVPTIFSTEAPFPSLLCTSSKTYPTD